MEMSSLILHILDECCTKNTATEAHIMDVNAYGKVAVALQDMIPNNVRA